MDRVDLGERGDLADRTVGELMVRAPKVHPVAGTTVADARDILRNDHVHMVLLVDADGRLVGTVVRDDLVGAPAESSAGEVARRDGRVASADQPVREVLPRLRGAVARRLAVVDGDDRLVGLLCLKRSREGFCDDAGVLARAAERVGTGHSWPLP